MSAEGHPGESVPPIVGLLRRFTRSSGKDTPGMTPTAEKASSDVEAKAPNASAISVAVHVVKMTSFTKWRAHLQRKAKKRKVQFPPSAWNVERSESGASSDTTQELAFHEGTRAALSEPTPGENAEATSDERLGQPAAVALLDPIPDIEMDDSPAAEEPMSPANVARRIQALLSSLPPFYALSPSGSLRLPKASPNTTDKTGDADGPLDDSKLLSLLTSATAMNGSGPAGRESVWSILERLRYLPGAKSDGQTAANEAGASGGDDAVETSSIMLCCPLEPTTDTEVEIARSEIVSINIEDEGPPAETSKQLGPIVNMWPFGKGKGKEKAESSSPKTSTPPPTAKEVRVWIPSRTKVSLQAAWWGYRIYLPPPVMQVLNDEALEAAKRAAMISAVLSWLISHIPTSMLPPSLRAVIEIVKGIVPIIGYVGGFIAWSWRTIQGFDKGQGVILSATWLLPVALIPGTWDFKPPPSGNNPSGSSESLPPRPPPKDGRPSLGAKK